MNGRQRHPWCAAWRFGWFTGTLLAAAVDYFFNCAFRDNSLPSRARWLQRSSRRTLSIFKFTSHFTGEIPTHGLLISNHLSYLDILVIASITPAVFVSKRDVKSWPVMGWLAQLAGTVFIDRERRTHVGPVNQEIQNALQAGVLLVIFPEGTSTNGKTLLPFKSSLLEPATHQKYPLTVSCLDYALGKNDGDASEEICYWGDHAFFSHLLNLLGKRAVHATIDFSPISECSADRKLLANQLHSAVNDLRKRSSKNVSSSVTIR